MNKSFFKNTLIAIPLLTSSAWAGGGEHIDSSDEAPFNLHLVLRLRAPALDTPDTRDVNLGVDSQTLVPQPLGNASNSDDLIREDDFEPSLTPSPISTPPNLCNELEEEDSIADSDTSLAGSPKISDEESGVKADGNTFPPEKIITPDPLLAEKKNLLLQIAELQEKNRVSQEELNLQGKSLKPPTDRSATKKKKSKHKGFFGQVDRFIGHIEKGKF